MTKFYLILDNYKIDNVCHKSLDSFLTKSILQNGNVSLRLIERQKVQKHSIVLLIWIELNNTRLHWAHDGIHAFPYLIENNLHEDIHARWVEKTQNYDLIKDNFVIFYVNMLEMEIRSWNIFENAKSNTWRIIARTFLCVDIALYFHLRLVDVFAVCCECDVVIKKLSLLDVEKITFRTFDFVANLPSGLKAPNINWE